MVQVETVQTPEKSNAQTHKLTNLQCHDTVAFEIPTKMTPSIVDEGQHCGHENFRSGQYTQNLNLVKPLSTSTDAEDQTNFFNVLRKK